MNKKGFTLVELLAVIAILAILVIIALPNVLKMYNNAKKNVFLTEAKIVHKESEKKYISELMNGNKIFKINSKGIKLELSGNELEYNILLDNNGKVKFFYASNGTYCISGKYKDASKLVIDDVKDKDCENQNYQPPVIKCTFDGEMKQGAEFVKGMYTYRYKQEADWYSYSSDSLNWYNIDDDGWGVQLTNKASTNPVSGEICTYINDKPVVSTALMFGNSKATSLDISEFNTSTVKYMWGMFDYSQASYLDLSTFDTSNVTDMSFMFRRTKASSIDMSSFDTSSVIWMHDMFMDSLATSLDLSNFNTSSVEDMSGMLAHTNVKSLDVSNFDTSKVEDIGGMFGCSKANEIIGLNRFNTSNVIYMMNMLMGTNVKTLDLSSFNTSKVKRIDGMFENSSVIELDLSSFDTSNVSDMYSMFRSCPDLKTIYVSDKFVTSNVTDDWGMFEDSTNLVGGAGTVYNSSNIYKSYARIDEGTSNPGYFTKKN